jgi:uncharacterized protein (TIGR02117 family)
MMIVDKWPPVPDQNKNLHCLKTAFKIFKTTGIIILSFILLIVVYFVSAFILSRISVGEEVTAEKDIAIYILTNGVHTDLVLPVRNGIKNWSEEIRFEHTLNKDTLVQYVAFGWGDKGFYLETPTWADLKLSTAFKAAFSLSTAAIHATFYHKLREGDNCKKIRVSLAQYSRLVAYIENSLSKDTDGRVMHISTNANYGYNDAFYEAEGSYSLFYTCNTWVNNGLKRCGQKASLWTPFDTGIFYHYSKNQ